MVQASPSVPSVYLTYWDPVFITCTDPTQQAFTQMAYTHLLQPPHLVLHIGSTLMVYADCHLGVYTGHSL